MFARHYDYRLVNKLSAASTLKFFSEVLRQCLTIDWRRALLDFTYVSGAT